VRILASSSKTTTLAAHLLAADLVSISIDYTEATTTTTSSTSTSTTSTTLAGGPARRAAWIHGRPLPPAATFTPTGKDAQIANAGYVTYNFGAETASTIGTDATYVFRMLLAFDISSLTGKTVTGCRLTIQTGSSNPGTGTTGTIYRITRSDWVEGAGTGTPVAGATWNDYDGSTWTTPGSDYDGSTPTPVSFTPPVGAAVFYEFPDISAFCQDAITSRSGSLDLLIRQDTETLGAHAFNMRTKESATTSTKPKLVVTIPIANKDMDMIARISIVIFLLGMAAPVWAKNISAATRAQVILALKEYCARSAPTSGMIGGLIRHMSGNAW